MSNVNEALKIWDALKPMIDKEIEAKTRSCVRAKKMVVKTAPNGSTIGVIEPFDTSPLNIPYSSAVKDAQVGEAVWVQWFFGNSSTMMAIAYGDGDMPYETIYDSGDVQIDTTPSGTNQYIICRRIGNVVTLRIGDLNTSSTTRVNVATLPDGFRPTTTVYSVPGADSSKGCIEIGADGTVNIFSLSGEITYYNGTYLTYVTDNNLPST